MPQEQLISLWDTTAAEEDYAATMDGDIRTELAIVGGGFTGLSTALHAAQKGVGAHVFESRKIGYGGSGRNVGLVNAGLWLPPQDVRRKLGQERGAKFVEMLGNAPDYVFSLIEKHQIRCEATRSGTIHAAHSPKGFNDLARRAVEWQRLGAPVDLLTRAEAGTKIGSEKFHGGLLDHRAGTINPMGYVRGLARAARTAGANISTGVTVQALNRQGDEWVLTTNRGTVRAKHVVLATNAYTDDLWPGLKNTFTMIHYFQLATEPLGERAAHILNGGQGLWDTGSIMLSLRRDVFGRIAIGSMGSVIGGISGLSQRWAQRTLQRLFPELGPVRFETAWRGRIAMTPDHLPRVFRLAEGLYTPIGYNGRGITPGTMFGKAMAGLLTGEKEEDLPLPVTDPKSIASRTIASRFYQTAFAANQLFKSL
ncbi:MAG: glycine/D-amino acid oxidase-like deaminating enzyme [Gammaproteobacteria bacterium]|jgi:glycine/D-amino acid oxidase-like deaminating enzyme